MWGCLSSIKLISALIQKGYISYTTRYCVSLKVVTVLKKRFLWQVTRWLVHWHCHIPDDLTLQQHTGLVLYLVAAAHNANTYRNGEVLRQQYWCSLHKLCRVLLHFCPSLIQYDFIVADFFMLQSLLGYYCDNEWLQDWGHTVENCGTSQWKVVRYTLHRPTKVD